MITGAETAHLSHKTPTIYLEGKLPLVVEKTAAELGLRDGQVVQATVESRLDQIRLNLQGPQQGQHIDLPKELPAGLRLASGDTALFRVQVLANGSIMLRPLQAAPTAAAANASPPPNPCLGARSNWAFARPTCTPWPSCSDPVYWKICWLVLAARLPCPVLCSNG